MKNSKLNGSAKSEPSALWPLTALVGPGSQERMQLAHWVSRIPVLPGGWQQPAKFIVSTSCLVCLLWTASGNKVCQIKISGWTLCWESYIIYDISDKARIEKIYMNLLPQKYSEREGGQMFPFGEQRAWEQWVGGATTKGPLRLLPQCLWMLPSSVRASHSSVLGQDLASNRCSRSIKYIHKSGSSDHRKTATCWGLTGEKL